MSRRGTGRFVWRIGSKPNYRPTEEKPEESTPPDPIARAVFGSSVAASGGQFDTVSAAMIGVDLDSKRIVSWNKAATELLGFERHEALEMWVEDLLPSKLRARFRADLTAFRINGRSRYIEPTRAVQIPMVRKDGEKLFVSILVSPLHSAESGAQHILGLVRDMSATNPSLGPDDDFDEVLRSPNEAIFFTDCVGVLMHWSPAAEKLFGYKSNDVLGKRLSTLIPTDVSRVEEEILTSSRASRTYSVTAVTLARKDGGPLKADLDTFPILEEDGNCTGVIVVVRESGQQTEAEGPEAILGSAEALDNV